jgi:hypothetical protein
MFDDEANVGPDRAMYSVSVSISQYAKSVELTTVGETLDTSPTSVLVFSLGDGWFW